MIGVVDVDLQVFKTMNTNDWYGQLRVVPECQYFQFNKNGEESHIEKRTKFFRNGSFNNILMVWCYNSKTDKELTYCV